MDNQHPISLASNLNERRGFALLDSALWDANSISILAWEPESLICGDIKTSCLTSQLIAAGVDIRGDAADSKGPIAIGALGFDGSYQFGIYQQYSVYHHNRNRWTSPCSSNHFEIAASTPHPAFRTPLTKASSLHLDPAISQDEYESWIARAKNYIAAGDIYQVCLAYPWLGHYDGGDAWSLYCQLRSSSPAPFGCFLRMEDQTLLGASPELFLRMTGRHIQTKPIKGTRPRGKTAEKNAELIHELITSEKERAELLMITDLERNDLGKICQVGSITVDKLIALEEFAQVHHLVSTISGTLLPEISHPEALISCSPGGSITGAPKKRAVEIIQEIERYPRGYYTGSTGVIGLNGQSIFNINIRTLILKGSEASYFTGAGIVADSCPTAEWQETLVKATPIYPLSQI